MQVLAYHAFTLQTHLCHPRQNTPTACIDENVCLESCRKDCATDAWLVIMDVVTAIRNNPVWYCGRCTRPISDDTQSSLVCECCLGWFHFQCLGINQPPKAKLWFCRKCCATAQGQYIATSIVFSTLDLANYIQFILYFMHLLCNAHYA